ncbi:MAG: autophagy-related protein 27 [Actinomycetota bacterium]|nr:autophagy-related protein 27 [Actinomycetota bacterium]
MAQPAKKPPVEAPVYDPAAVQREYRRNRAKREAVKERKRARRAAGVRFWLVILALVALSIYLGLTIWHQIQKLFGL